MKLTEHVIVIRFFRHSVYRTCCVLHFTPRVVIVAEPVYYLLHTLLFRPFCRGMAALFGVERDSLARSK